MRSKLLATIATFGLAFGGAAMAQTTYYGTMPVQPGPVQPAPMPGYVQSGPVRPGHMPGDGLSEPASNRASNITPGDTRSAIAPRLPGAASPGLDETSMQYLQTAQMALSRNQTGAAQEALERAETRLLDRSTPQGMTDVPSSNPVVATISQAREAVGNHDLATAQSLISRAMTMRAEG